MPRSNNRAVPLLGRFPQLLVVMLLRTSDLDMTGVPSFPSTPGCLITDFDRQDSFASTLPAEAKQSSRTCLHRRGTCHQQRLEIPAREVEAIDEHGIDVAGIVDVG